MPLHVVATPIGNLGDISERARETLARVSVVAAEDTRVTRKLYSALGLSAPELVSYRGHNEARIAASLVERLEAGVEIALVSDAGTPAVSDPGVALVAECHRRGVEVIAVAGPSAATAAISVSGVDAVPFHFLGFSPRKRGPLREWIRRFGALEGALVIYEAPSRAIGLLEAIEELLPTRQVTICRELTKKFEEVRSGSATELLESLQERDQVRGEFVVVIGPGEPPVARPEEPIKSNLKGIAAALAERWGVTKREAYDELLALERKREG